MLFWDSFIHMYKSHLQHVVYTCIINIISSGASFISQVHLRPSFVHLRKNDLDLWPWN